MVKLMGPFFFKLIGKYFVLRKSAKNVTEFKYFGMTVINQKMIFMMKLKAIMRMS
jgi:hypothetical protein